MFRLLLCCPHYTLMQISLRPAVHTCRGRITRTALNCVIPASDTVAMLDGAVGGFDLGKVTCSLVLMVSIGWIAAWANVLAVVPARTYCTCARNRNHEL